MTSATRLSAIAELVQSIDTKAVAAKKAAAETKCLLRHIAPRLTLAPSLLRTGTGFYCTKGSVFSNVAQFLPEFRSASTFTTPSS